jgi:hypothetical protein
MQPRFNNPTQEWHFKSKLALVTCVQIARSLKLRSALSTKPFAEKRITLLTIVP